MHYELLSSTTIFAAAGILGLARPTSSRTLTRRYEIGFWIIWAIIGAYLLVAAGLFLFVPFVAVVLLFKLVSRPDPTGSQARPLHLAGVSHSKT
jgi:hypothetical protein